MKFYQRVSVLLLLFPVAFISLSLTPKEETNKFEIIKNLEIFSNLYKELNTHYVDELDPGKLMRLGVDAMLESLDPFTNYIAESDIENYRFMTEGRYQGIGARIKKRNGKFVITEPYEDSPAVKAGLQAGDLLLEVDGKSTEGKLQSDVTEILEGFPGSEVVLTIQRPGESGTKKIKLIRGEVNIPNVPYSGMVTDKVGYVALTTFTQNAGRNVWDNLRDLRRDHPDMEGVILDLRGNGGGLLIEAVNVVNTFVPKGEMVVSMRGKVKERDRTFKTTQQAIDEDIPVVVLIDDGSASASEIVSGALQDLDRGVLMGQRSYGKGLVQNTLDVGYNAKLKLTTAKYYIPSGRCIQSVQYRDGEPVHIPDDQRAEFKTRGGRTVLDGGGVKPDVFLESGEDAPIVKALVKGFYIFDYATRYRQEQPSLEDARTFRFTDFEAFLDFLEEKGFQYQTPAEKKLADLEKALEEEGGTASIVSELDQIREALQANQRAALEKHREAILRMLSKEIVGRYHYEKGRTENGLQNDPEVMQAAELLEDQEAYQSLLVAQ